MSVSRVGAGWQGAVGNSLAAVRPAHEAGVVRADEKSSSNANHSGSFHVDLSMVARTFSAHGGRPGGATDNADIDESSLPRTVKDILKRIRELKEKLQDLQQRMKVLQSDASLSPEQKQAQLQQLQAQIQTVSSALSVASGSLNDAIKAQALSKDQLTEIVSLLTV